MSVRMTRAELAAICAEADKRRRDDRRDMLKREISDVLEFWEAIIPSGDRDAVAGLIADRVMAVEPAGS